MPSFTLSSCSTNIDYIIIFIDVENWGSPLPDSILQHLATVQRLTNVEIVHRENMGLDFCSYAEIVARLGGLEVLQRLYKYFLFINGT